MVPICTGGALDKLKVKSPRCKIIMSNNIIKKEPEDILAEVDKLQKAPPSPKLRRAKAEEIGKEKIVAAAPSHRLPFVIGGTIVIVIVAGIAGYLMLSQSSSNNGSIANTNKTNSSVNSQKANVNTNTNTAETSNVNTAEANVSQKITNDTDGDGLINEDEAKAGTDSKNPDTDGDNLSDREEVKVWKTNPLKADTDGDGYNDGEEIKTLNDPKVPGGKLLDLNKAIQSLNINK